MRIPRLPRRRPISQDEREEWMATAGQYSRRLTETGSRCHLNHGASRFCSWKATELPATELPATDREGEATPMVGVRCIVHAGGRYLDADARLDPSDFA